MRLNSDRGTGAPHPRLKITPEPAGISKVTRPAAERCRYRADTIP